MKKRYLGYLMVFLLLGGIISNFKMHHKNTQHENLDCWIGEYRYTESFARSEESAEEEYVYYNITLWKQEDGYYAIVQDENYFDRSDVISWSFASVSGDENKIDITFLQTLARDKLYGIKQRYQEGELLLSLEQDGYKLITEWGALRDRSPKLHQKEGVVVGRYFQFKEPYR